MSAVHKSGGRGPVHAGRTRGRGWRHILALLGVVGGLLLLEAGMVELRAHGEITLLQAWGRPALWMTTLVLVAYGDIAVGHMIRYLRRVWSGKRPEDRGNRMK